MHGSLETVEYYDQGTISDVPFWQKYRAQVPIIIAVTAALQYGFAVYGQGLPPESDLVVYSVIIALGANTGGLLWYRRMRLYPGTWRLSFLLPTMAMSWAVSLAGLTIFRIPYSVSLLSIGLASAMTLALIASVWIRKPKSQEFSVISSPRVDAALAELPDLPYNICRTADDILNSDAPVVADLHTQLPSDWEAAIVQATLQGRSVYHIKQISESLTGRVQIDHLSENALGTLAPDQSYTFLKAIAERTAAAALLVFLAPLFVLAAIAIRLDSPGPAIFRQTRIGLGGRPFTIFKMRTMTYNEGPSTLEVDMTKENDPRITRLGSFLRKSRIDEIPQLINIARGEMSFIGPRPETVNLSSWYAETIDFYAYRHVVLPGISGWAQVKQGHVTSTDDVLRKLQYDLYYIKNFSFWLDIVIIMKPFKIMILKLGAK